MAIALTLCGVALPSTVALASSRPAFRVMTFASGTGWETFAADPGARAADRRPRSLGAAQNVCLTESAPSPCPAGALIYGSGSGWFADLSPIPGATWVWAPGITAATRPAELASFYFSKRITVPGHPVAATVSVAVDDFAEVLVNGTLVGSTGSISDVGLAGQAQNSLASFSVTSYLKPGANTITIHGQNGPASFPGCEAPCSYEENVAGIAFGGSVYFDQHH